MNKSALQDENRQLRDRKLCKVCCEEDVCIVFLPCAHLVCCAQCAPAIHNCAVCRKPVKGTVRVTLALWILFFLLGYLGERLRSSFRKFYGRYGDLIQQYKSIPLTNVKRHSDPWPTVTSHQSDFQPISWPWYRAWPSPIMSGFHGAFATGVVCQQGTLTLPDTWFRPPIWDLLVLQFTGKNTLRNFQYRSHCKWGYALKSRPWSLLYRWGYEYIPSVVIKTWRIFQEIHQYLI